MKILKILLAYLLITSFGINISKDVLHSYHSHEQEITHRDLDCHKIHFETKHEHCATHHLTLPFAQLELSRIFFNGHSLDCIYNISDYSIPLLKNQYLFGLKAPPMFC